MKQVRIKFAIDTLVRFLNTWYMQCEKAVQYTKQKQTRNHIYSSPPTAREACRPASKDSNSNARLKVSIKVTLPSSVGVSGSSNYSIHEDGQTLRLLIDLGGGAIRDARFKKLPKHEVFV